MISYGRWTLKVGDPDFLGWLTCFLYFCTGICSLIAYKKSRHTNNLLWLIIGTLFLLLSINKQLDLHRLITEFGRNLAHKQGWYQYKHEIELIFMMSLLSLYLCLLALIYKKLSNFNKHQLAAVLGVSCTILYALLKVFSFHHLDYWLTFTFDFLNFLWILEIGGIAIVLITLIQYLLKTSPR